MVVLVTGATGFVGREVVRTLVNQGDEVRCLVHTPGAEEIFGNERVDVHYGSVTDPLALRAAFYDVDEVVHLVAIIRERKGATFRGINFRGVQNVVEAASAAGVKRVVHLSAMGANDNLSASYLHSKWLGEQAIIHSGLAYTILRSSLIFGEGDEFINGIAGLVKALPLIPIVGPGNNELQLIAVEEVARCVASSVHEKNVVNCTIEIGGSERLRYSEIVDIVIDTLGASRLKVYLPLLVAKPIVRTLEAILPRSIVTSDQLKMLSIPSIGDVGTVEEIFGFSPRRLEGNIDFARKMNFLDGLKICLGFMPHYIRDH